MEGIILAETTGHGVGGTGAPILSPEAQQMLIFGALGAGYAFFGYLNNVYDNEETRFNARKALRPTLLMAVAGALIAYNGMPFSVENLEAMAPAAALLLDKFYGAEKKRKRNRILSQSRDNE